MSDEGGRFAADLYAARQAFRDIVWPRIEWKFRKGGKLISVEDIFGDEPLDKESGIDWFHKLRNGERRGLAARVQFLVPGMRPYNSFTIRDSREGLGENTEMLKRRLAITAGALRPRFVIQAYVCRQRFISAAIIDADMLYRDVLDTHRAEIERGRRLNGQGRGNATFLPVWWHKLKEWGYRVVIVDTGEMP